jgi:hypothetical protein
VVFLYFQTVSGFPGANTYERGLKDVEGFELSGAYGYDRVEKGKPSLVAGYKSLGTPWTVVIGKDGVVRFSKYTHEGLVRQAINAALRK